MSEVTPVIYLLAGVTAAGKSDLSLKWAEQMRGEILSCDSIAIYRGMDIGSAKPSADERKRVCHHGIDIVDADTIFSVVDYLLYAKGVVGKAVEKSTPVLVTGGSGFYLQSFLSPVVDEINVGMEVRQQVEKLNEERGLDGLLQALKEHNPDGLGDLDVLNPRRVMRALERCLASGKTILELKKNSKGRKHPMLISKRGSYGWTGKMKKLKRELLREHSKCLMMDFLKRLKNYFLSVSREIHLLRIPLVTENALRA